MQLSQTKQGPILLDGGMGQELVKRSHREPTPLWSTQVLLDQPELVEQVHLDYIRAGARVITVNSYTLTPGRLARAEIEQNKFNMLHNKALDLAESACLKALELGYINSRQDVQIAGCLPPLRASYLPSSAPNQTICEQEYEALVDVQKNKVDLFLIETMTSLTETDAALKYAKKSGLPTWVAFVPEEFAENNNEQVLLKGGMPLVNIVPLLQLRQPNAVLLNCASPEAITQAMPSLVQYAKACDFDMLLGAYGNRFVSTNALKEGGTVAALKTRDNPTPKQYCDFAKIWVDMGCHIVGGCCEIDPTYIHELSQHFDV